jgi:magnesium transporter
VTAAQSLVAEYVATRPAAVARHVERMLPADAAALVPELPPEAGASLLQHLALPFAAGVIAALQPDAAADVLSRLPIDSATALLRQVDADVTTRLLEALPADLANQIRSQLAYPAESAAGVMDPRVLTIPDEMTVAEARRLIELHPAHLYYYVYVVDAAHRLAGVFDLAKLMRARPGDAVRTLMSTGVVWLSAEAPLATVFAHPGWRDFDALPIVGDDRRFLGVLRHRRMRQLAERHRPDGANDRTVRTVMALGEIYWLGLCGLIEGLANTTGAPQTAGGTTS